MTVTLTVTVTVTRTSTGSPIVPPPAVTNSQFIPPFLLSFGLVPAEMQAASQAVQPPRSRWQQFPSHRQHPAAYLMPLAPALVCTFAYDFLSTFV